MKPQLRDLPKSDMPAYTSVTLWLGPYLDMQSLFT